MSGRAKKLARDEEWLSGSAHVYTSWLNSPLAPNPAVVELQEEQPRQMQLRPRINNGRGAQVNKSAQPVPAQPALPAEPNPQNQLAVGPRRLKRRNNPQEPNHVESPAVVSTRNGRHGPIRKVFPSLLDTLILYLHIAQYIWQRPDSLNLCVKVVSSVKIGPSSLLKYSLLSITSLKTKQLK